MPILYGPLDWRPRINGDRIYLSNLTGITVNKRHAKPTSAQLLARIYRRQISLDAAITQLAIKERDRSFLYNARMDSLVSGQKMLSERMESFRVLVDHCHRLLKEKETMQKELEKSKSPLSGYQSQLKQANTFMAQAIPTPDTETIEYPCGCSATGIAPLPPACGVHNQIVKRSDFQGVRPAACSFESSHRTGIRCAVCGVTP